ncbi:hypothetical protein QAD02_005203 [Eretmocerus hayati]|uniref:Uncharacterized protein n=1 Tax=Eretmocerus hayati TaxID=131215 RepID=A0ACC2NS23_9HYME|nr:hypothetical protein QAD02_005203 [Eretmocerus hayati]
MGLPAVIKQSYIAHLLFAITFFTSGLVINFFQCILYLGLRPFSKYWYRKINYYLCYSFYCQLVFMAEWWSGTDVVIYIKKDDFDKYYGNEHGYLLMNHSYEIDWLMGWMFCERIRMLGNCKAYAKKSIQYVPTLGWAWKFAESIFLERSWEKDKEIIGDQIKELTDYPDTMWLLLYAEGTRFTQEKSKASQDFARQKGLPILKHHLTPRTRGFIASMPHLRGKVKAIYDIQLAFKPSESVKPTMKNLLLGRKVEAHMYINRIPLDSVPENDEAAAQWLHDIYLTKDKMAESFIQTGDFFATSGVPRVEPFKLPRRYWSLVNTLFWATAVLVPMLYYLVKLFLSGSTVYISIGVGIIILFFLMLHKVMGMSEISKSSSYGSAETKKAK